MPKASITVNEDDLRHGDTVSFTVTTDNPYPVVTVYGYVDGHLVYSDSGPYYQPNSFGFDGVFTLVSLAWTEGPADCIAQLRVQKGHKVVTEAEVAFSVSE